MSLPLLRNFTSHVQGHREREIARQAGLRLLPYPEGVLLPSNGPERPSIVTLAHRLAAAVQQGEAVLVGGSCRLWIPAVLACRQLLPSRAGWLYAFRTRRLRDSFGRFRFVPVSLEQLDLNYVVPRPSCTPCRKKKGGPECS